MAKKILGQAAPAATTAVDLYVVPSAKSAVCSTLMVCNRGATATTYRVSVAAAGAGAANAQYLAYDVNLPANTSDPLTLGITLAATDVLRVYAGNANLSFNLFGDES